jgi:hypothetical protein
MIPEKSERPQIMPTLRLRHTSYITLTGLTNGERINFTVPNLFGVLITLVVDQLIWIQAIGLVV